MEEKEDGLSQRARVEKPMQYKPHLHPNFSLVQRNQSTKGLDAHQQSTKTCSLGTIQASPCLSAEQQPGLFLLGFFLWVGLEGFFLVSFDVGFLFVRFCFGLVWFFYILLFPFFVVVFVSSEKHPS